MATLPDMPILKDFNVLPGNKTEENIERATRLFEESARKKKLAKKQPTGNVLSLTKKYANSRDNLFKNSWFVEKLIGKLSEMEDIMNFVTSTNGYINWDKVHVPEFRRLDLKLYKRACLWTYTAEHEGEIFVMKSLNPFFVTIAKSILMEAQELYEFDVDAPVKNLYTFDKATLSKKDISVLLNCKNLRELSIKGFGISEEACVFLRACDSDNRLENITKSLRVLRLEDVYYKLPTNQKVSFVNFLMNRTLPFDFIQFMIKLKNLEVLELRAMCISEDMIKEMVVWLDGKNKLSNLREISLIDVITKEDDKGHLDETLITLIKHNNPEQMTLKLSIQLQTYGFTLLRKLVVEAVRFKKLYLVVNENALNEATIFLIGKCQEFCEEMTLVFHETYFNLESPCFAISQMISAEFPSWDKVTEVIIGKEVYFLRTRKEPQDRLFMYIIHLPLLSNLRTVRIEDRTSFETFRALHKLILPNLNIEEFSIRHYDAYPKSKQFELARLLHSLPADLKKLTLAPFPLESWTFDLISYRMPNLENLMMYAHSARIDVLKEQFSRRYPESSSIVIRTGNLAVEQRSMAISYWLANVERSSFFVF